jgi:zinc transporter ZupT
MHEDALTAIGFLFPWVGTSLGAAIVLFFPHKMPDTFRTVILAFAGGVMISCSFFALLMESLEEAELLEPNYPYWLPAFLGFLIGCLFIYVLDLLIPHLIPAGEPVDNSEVAKLRSPTRPTRSLPGAIPRWRRQTLRTVPLWRCL